METELITVRVNGEPRQAPANQTVAAFLDGLGIASERVAVELDKAIVRKRDWQNTRIANGAQLEIVEFVGGG